MLLSFIGLSASAKDSSSMITVPSHLSTWEVVSKAGSRAQIINPFYVAEHALANKRSKWDEDSDANFHMRLMRRYNLVNLNNLFKKNARPSLSRHF